MSTTKTGNGNKQPNANEVINDLVVTGKSTTGLSFDDAWKIAENMPVEVMEELSSEYFKGWERGKIYTFLVTGFGTATLKDKAVEVVQFQDRTGRKLINGDKTFYSGCKRLDVALPCFVKAVYEKEIKGDKGEYLDIRVFALPK